MTIAGRTLVADEVVIDQTIDSPWTAVGLPAEHAARWRTTNAQLADLSGLYLGYATFSTIWIDRNAGYGWLVDTTPANDEEFSAFGRGRLEGFEPLTAGIFDQLTVLEHGTNHLLCMQHDAADDLMSILQDHAVLHRVSSEAVDLVIE